MTESAYKGMYEEYANAKARSYASDRFQPTSFVGYRNYVRERLSFSLLQLGSDDRFLDIGCASGLQVLKAGKICELAVGVDIAESFISVANAQANAANLNSVSFRIANAESLPFDDDSFSAILIMEMLDHVVDVEAVLTEAARVSKPNARLVLTLPNINHDGTAWGRLKRAMGTSSFKPLSEFSFSAAAHHGDMHVREFTSSAVKELVERNGFVVDQITYAWHVDFPKAEQVLGKIARLRTARAVLLGLDRTLARLPLLRRFGGTIVVRARRVAHSDIESRVK